jgi:hypothetical protein
MKMNPDPQFLSSNIAVADPAVGMSHAHIFRNLGFQPKSHTPPRQAPTEKSARDLAAAGKSWGVGFIWISGEG